jgi:hypothetical protein
MTEIQVIAGDLRWEAEMNELVVIQVWNTYQSIYTALLQRQLGVSRGWGIHVAKVRTLRFLSSVYRSRLNHRRLDFIPGTRFPGG